MTDVNLGGEAGVRFPLIAVEIPHQCAPSGWCALDEDDFWRTIDHDLADYREDEYGELTVASALEYLGSDLHLLLIVDDPAECRRLLAATAPGGAGGAGPAHQFNRWQLELAGEAAMLSTEGDDSAR